MSIFICLIAICIFFFVNCLFMFFVHISPSFLLFFFWISRDSFYISKCSPLTVIWFANIFLQLILMLFLNVKFMNFMWLRLSTFSFHFLLLSHWDKGYFHFVAFKRILPCYGFIFLYLNPNSIWNLNMVLLMNSKASFSRWLFFCPQHNVLNFMFITAD